MPFTYELPVPEIPPEALEDSGGVRLERFLIEESAWVEAGTAVAELKSETAVIRVLANGTGILRRRVAAVGATLRAGDVLAVVEADGEAVPYDRPYSLADLSLVAE
jgi:pyruvate/2-oxoglutarate dehydrogenase complex dihydrolipoamide acyltransferase (E2) component